ncbi:class E sortase [Candidatus Microgenomates bacterium]|nr:class E sortase [Candidatus Microgenomates bacterium]
MIGNLRIAPGKLIALSFLSIGVVILMQVVLPLLSFQIWLFAQKYNDNLLITPKPQKAPQVLGISIQTKDRFPAFISSIIRETKPNYGEFSLTVPRLKIENVGVLVDSNDLSKKLAHLSGSALPGEKGNVFISGHSALSQFFSMKKAVFSNLSDLKKGDQVSISAGGIEFTYQVLSVKIVDPSDVSVIAPPDTSGRYLSLMTCVPPGLNTKRLVVLAKMI